MAAIQLNFTLRTTPGCKTVHLLGSWDNYQGQLPLSSSKSGSWTGTFRFQGGTMQQGQRYWYYYIMDGYHVSHDPAVSSVVEPTTGRKLNVLDVPASKTKTAAPKPSTRSSRRYSKEVPRGRGVSPSQIKSPKPYNPVQTAHLVAADYSHATVDQLTARFGAAQLDDDSDSDSDDSDADSDVPSLTSSRSSNSSSPSSVSSNSSYCSCERYGITRSGNRVKLDCGGARCGYSDSESCGSESETEAYSSKHANSTRRHGVVIRGRA
ncbi:hypothetical protein EJ08DRAFT_254838 [Tothia fuscella]|uniref:GTP-binding protein EsdC n=1 Tax=Tothia fuscella TaxID=1048955 RepID=A0A9P4TYS8_9PEZI|nr:hypothetical protein EJ08DRAFT_254838 [Tothia fuscella]